METKLKKGSRVSHPTCGTGTITTINGDGDRCHIRTGISEQLHNVRVDELTLLDAPEYDRAGMATAAMQGLLGIDWEIKQEPIEDTLAKMVAWQAVKCADALIAELQKPKP